jgi:DNA replication protein DnaC
VLIHPLLPKMKQLRLSGMLETLEERAELARAQNLTPIEFFGLLLDDEIDRRNRCATERREKAACFESDKRMADFDFAASPTLSKSLILEMATCRFVAEKENWLLHGPTGVGKSHIATATGREAIRKGYTVLSCSTHKLLADLFGARADGSYQRKMNRLSAVDLLILDDFGLRPTANPGGDDLYEIIHRRYERGAILLTSNRDPSEWADLFGDNLLASAALDRLTHHARVTAITGESYRQRQRRKGPLPASSEPSEASRDASGA